MEVFGEWLEASNEVLNIWWAFTKDGRIRRNEEVEGIKRLYGYDFSFAELKALSQKVRLMGRDARLTSLAKELSDAVGKPYEERWANCLNDLYRKAERLEFIYCGERNPDKPTPDTIKRAYFFGYRDNDDEVNQLNTELLNLFSTLGASLTNVLTMLEEVFPDKPRKKETYRCKHLDILDEIRLFFRDIKAHNLPRKKFEQTALEADFSKVYGSIDGNKAKVKYMISCLSPLFSAEWYRDAAQSIGFKPRDCSSANVMEDIKEGWNSTKTRQMITKKERW